jgi:hypothetical protein
MKNFAYDIEIAKNCFMIIFIPIDIDIIKINDLLVEHDKLEIKEILVKYNVTFYEFIINKTRNDLVDIIKFVNRNVTLYSFNGKDYDNMFLNYMMLYYNRLKMSTNLSIVKELYNLNTLLIDHNIDWWQHSLLKTLHYYERKYWSIDMFRYFETKERKSLKQTSILLKWNRVKDIPFSIIINDVEETSNYCINDVLITIMLVYYHKDNINLRFELYKEFELGSMTDKVQYEKVLNANKATIGDIIGAKLYSDATNLNYYEYKNTHTSRNVVNIGSVISEKVKFKTKEFNEFLNKLYNTDIVNTKGDINFEVSLNNIIYSIKTGGLHSKDTPDIFLTTGDTLILDWDFDSYYPNLIDVLKIEPAHLVEGVYHNLAKDVIKIRIAAKKINKKGAKAYGLKIVLNSWLFGKMNADGSWTKDMLAAVKTTINGQLFLLMMVEEYVLSNITPISANTDGITCKVPLNLLDKYSEINQKYVEHLGITGEVNQYKLYARRDVNNYIAVLDDGSIKTKGLFTPKLQIEKGNKTPLIISIALYEYFVNNVDIEKTILEHIKKPQDVLDFCMSIKIGKKSTLKYIYLKGNKKVEENVQRNTRFYISNTGGILIKHMSGNRKQNMLKNQYHTIFNNVVVKDDYNIYYKYYIVETQKIINSIKHTPVIRRSEHFVKPIKKKKANSIGNYKLEL